MRQQCRRCRTVRGKDNVALIMGSKGAFALLALGGDVCLFYSAESFLSIILISVFLETSKISCGISKVNLKE